MAPKVKHLGSDRETKSLARGEAPFTPSVPQTPRELAEVTAYSSTHNAYQVVTRGVGGRPEQPAGRQLRGIPRKVESPGTVAPLPLGTVVVVDWSLGFPYIDGVLNVDSSRVKVEDGPQPSSNIGGDESVLLDGDTSVQTNSGYYREPGTPSDVMAGDWVHTTPEGNKIAALRGGYNVMGSGPQAKAKIETFGDRDLTRITTEDFELNTGFGILKIQNTEGRCGLSFRAAVDQLTESGGSEDQWTFKLDIGETGDYFAMEVASPDGRTQSKIGMTPDGQVTLLGTNGVSIVDGGKTASHLEYASNLLLKVMGSLKQTVRGEVVETFEASQTTQVSESRNVVVGQNEGISVNNNRTLSVGGVEQKIISGGSPITANPSNIAVETQVLNGGYFLELGNPTQGANPAALAGFTVAVNNGEVSLGENPDPLALPSLNAAVNLNTRLPRSVRLGGTSFNTPWNAVLYQPLAVLLQTMMALHDTHVHLPPIGGIPAPTNIMLTNAAVQQGLVSMMSQRVVMGA